MRLPVFSQHCYNVLSDSRRFEWIYLGLAGVKHPRASCEHGQKRMKEERHEN
jgi:hypothetical protein